jgi:hypothetical protein
MKRLNSSALVLFLTISAMLFAGANQVVKAAGRQFSTNADAISATGVADGARLIIKPSPTLGYDVGIVFTIDGKISGGVVRGQNYESYISPGRHIVVASPNHLGDDWRVTLDARRGQTYCYVVSYSESKAWLTPARECP